MWSDSTGLAAKATIINLEAMISKGDCEDIEVAVPTFPANSFIENPGENTSSDVSDWHLPKGTRIAATRQVIFRRGTLYK